MTPDQSPEPGLIVIFGISGDLSRKYLIPALYQLLRENQLHDQTRIIGVSRQDLSVEDIYSRIDFATNHPGQQLDEKIKNELYKRTQMVHLDLASQTDYNELKSLLQQIEDQAQICMHRLFYLSVPPRAHHEIIANLGKAGLNASCKHNQADSRLLIEKPFGYDTASATSLINETAKYFKEEQIFRIDHYIAKETVQAIIKFRFENEVFDSQWNNQNIEKIEIIAKEKIGIQGRAVFYEPLGALRDFIQSHLLQILGIILMQKPSHLTSEVIHQNKQQALESILPMDANKAKANSVRGQYDDYKKEVNNADSQTETFAAIKLYSNTEHWQNVPLYLVTGKGLDERKTEVNVFFSQAENLTFKIVTEGNGHLNAYEKVLTEAIKGDRTLFATSEEIVTSWKVVQPILDAWQANSVALDVYTKGSPGPDLSKLF